MKAYEEKLDNLDKRKICLLSRHFSNPLNPRVNSKSHYGKTHLPAYITELSEMIGRAPDSHPNLEHDPGSPIPIYGPASFPNTVNYEKKRDEEVLEILKSLDCENDVLVSDIAMYSHILCEERTLKSRVSELPREFHDIVIKRK